MLIAMDVDPGAALHELEYLVVDVETTGCAPTRADRVTEVAAVLMRGGVEVDGYTSLVNPGRAIPQAIVRLTGITDAMVVDAPAFADIVDDLSRLVRGRVFVAHNASFDWAFITEELRRAAAPELAAARLCTVRLARRLLAHLPRRNLDALTAHYGIEIVARHRALGDARATAQVLQRMLDELGARGVHTWSDLDGVLHPRARPRRRTALPTSMTDWSIA